MSDMMSVVGLTGGIGTGKSTAAQLLKEKGFYHIDADEIGRHITADGSPMLSVLDSLFGPAAPYGRAGVPILHEDGTLDRKALASIVFTDAEKKHRLDAVMFKAIIEEIDRQVSEIRNCTDMNYAGILLDAPLLFEAGLDSRCDMILLMTADETVRIQRVCQRDDVTEEEVKNRINSQMSDEAKKKRAHVIVENSGSRKELEAKLEIFFAKFSNNSCKRFTAVL